jgi:HSP20 family protein
MSEKTEKTKIPAFWGSCNQKLEEDNACVEIELPGVKKEDIKLTMTDQTFSLSAPKEDIEYVGAWSWCCPVDSSEAKATYDNGLLKIEAPKKPGPPTREIEVE